MKRLALAQIVLGTCVIVFSWASFNHARLVQPPHGLTIPGYDSSRVFIHTPPPPTPFAEATTAVLGLAIVVCGAIQKQLKIKLAGCQTLFGISIALGSVILANAYHDRTIFGDIFYLGFFTMFLGIVTAVTGIDQFRTAKVKM
ncbi:MAG: hypothetical protein TUN42_08340 [Dehalogenimonas sp.]